MKTIPQNCKPYKRTPVFSESSVPAGLLRAHQTKVGTWGSIVVVEGQLLYRVLEPETTEYLLDSQQSGVVEPGVLHEVEPQGNVRFFVEFYRAEDGG